MAFSAEISTEGKAKFSTAGIPMAYKRPTRCRDGRRCCKRILTEMGRR